MPRAVEKVLVKAPKDTVWELLLDKAENPQRYLEGILDFRVLGRGEGWLRRELQLEDAQWLRETVRIDPELGELSFQLEEHPVFEGRVVNRLEPAGPDAVALTFEMDWAAKPGAPPAGSPVELIHGAIERTRAIAEELARAAEEAGGER